MKSLIARLFRSGKIRSTESTDDGSVEGKQDFLDHLTEKVSPHRKTAWFPVTDEGDGDGRSSKFAGIAYIPEDQEWPRCGHCHKPMQLFVQINSEEIPSDARELLPAGILQLFYCTDQDQNCEVSAESYFPFSTASLVRIITPSTPAAALGASPVHNAFPARRIVGWTETFDHPNAEELSDLGVKLTDAESESLDEARLRPAPGEKLGGWPAWVQGVEYPACPKCGTTMKLLFQLDSEENLPYMFGDAGCGHITQCPEHREILAFGWACC